MGAQLVQMGIPGRSRTVSKILMIGLARIMIKGNQGFGIGFVIIKTRMAITILFWTLVIAWGD